MGKLFVIAEVNPKEIAVPDNFGRVLYHSIKGSKNGCFYIPPDQVIDTDNLVMDIPQNGDLAFYRHTDHGWGWHIKRGYGTNQRMILKSPKSDLKTMLENHHNLWTWIAKNPEKAKEDWPGWEQFPNMEGECFACQWVHNTFGHECKDGKIHCPLDWPSGSCVGESSHIV